MSTRRGQPETKLVSKPFLLISFLLISNNPFFAKVAARTSSWDLALNHERPAHTDRPLAVNHWGGICKNDANLTRRQRARSAGAAIASIACLFVP
jgi:hypothetical protein